MLKKTIVTIVAVLGLTGAAEAVTLRSAPLWVHTGDTISCMLFNVGRSPLPTAVPGRDPRPAQLVDQFAPVGGPQQDALGHQHGGHRPGPAVGPVAVEPGLQVDPLGQQGLRHRGLRLAAWLLAGLILLGSVTTWRGIRKERRLSELKSHFIAGDQFSIADITAFITLDFAKRGELEVPSIAANILRWQAEIAARPSASA